MPTFDQSQTQKQASHDTLNPPKLVEFMLQGWKMAKRGKVPRVAGARGFAERRKKLSALFPSDLLVVPTGHEKVRANDTNFRFRPGSDFYYLTGNLEPDCVLLLVPSATGHEAWLFVEPNPGRSSPTFFTDRNKGELWVGPRLGVEQSRERYHVDRCLGLPELRGQLAELCGAHAHRVLRGIDPDVDGLVQGRREDDQKLGTVLSELRLVKDALEVRALQRAIDSTRRAFEDVVRELGGVQSEREVEGIFNKRARIEGNDVGYGTIAAAGGNATILHWTRNDGVIRKGTLLLLDAGVEGHELYTADVTRTLPIGGRFTVAQREIYSLVLEAQRVAFREVAPGKDFMAPNRAAMTHLAHGLFALGILKSSPEEALADEHQFYKRYSLHNVSHMLGLDVHDCAQARAESYKYGRLEAGMVLTVEPGLYFQRDDLTVPARYRGIGVRIEDDVVVTSKGCRILTDAFPREVADVERWVSRAAKKRRS
jgi:Xaa-Pro aminopeptidase